MTKNELKILIGLHRTVNYIDKQSLKIFSKHNLTIGQFGVLEALYHKGNMTIGQVQEKILSSSGTIPLIINNLEKRGYIVKNIDSKDKRKCILQITNLGKQLVEEVYPENEQQIIEVMKCWSDKEQQQLASLLKKFGDEINGKKN